MPHRASARLIQQLSRSKIYRDYEEAFTRTTKMPLTLRPTQIFNLTHQGKRQQNPFCALLAKTSKSCAACLEVQEKLSDTNSCKTQTAFCFAGLCDSTVPVEAAGRIVGFLQTGQVAMEKPTKKQFTKVAAQLLEWGVQVDLKKLEEAYFHSQVIDEKRYNAMLKLLEVFAQHLSSAYNQISIQGQNVESPMILKAKSYIKDHQADPLSLDEVSKALNVSSFYFCKMFKKATGLTFTDYLSRVRIEKAKNLLINPHARVSEVAFEVGFQSLNHFNRIFKNITGLAPTAFRKSLTANSS